MWLGLLLILLLSFYAGHDCTVHVQTIYAPHSRYPIITLSLSNYHMQGCIECSNADCTTYNILSGDGPGVSGADIIMYVAAAPDSPCGEGVIAYAGACYLENTLDRSVTTYLFSFLLWIRSLVACQFSVILRLIIA